MLKFYWETLVLNQPKKRILAAAGVALLNAPTKIHFNFQQLHLKQKHFHSQLQFDVNLKTMGRKQNFVLFELL